MRVTMRCAHCKNPIIIAEATHIRYAISTMKQYMDGRIDVNCKACGRPRTIVPKRTVVLTQPEKVSIVGE